MTMVQVLIQLEAFKLKTRKSGGWYMTAVNISNVVILLEQLERGLYIHYALRY
jgi:hypothetical protein